MNEAQATHGDDEQLLRLTDGELPPDEVERLRAHVDGCAECRARLDEVRAASALYGEFHDESKTNHPAPPRAWEDLRPSLDALDSSSLRVRGRTYAKWLAAAAAIVAAVIVWNRIGLTPPVSAAELLRKAVEAAPRQPDPKRRIRVRAQGRSEVRPAVWIGASESDVSRLFAAARYSWEEPLSARNFEEWHDRLAEKQDHIAKLGAAYEIRTTTHSSSLTEAVLVLEASDLRPVRGSMRFGDELVEVSEAEPETTAAPAPTLPPANVAAPAARTASAGDELRLIAALHAISADLGEPVEVTRAGGALVLTGTGLSPEREKQVREAASTVPGTVVRFTQPRVADAAPAGSEKPGVAAAGRSELSERLGEETVNRALDASEAVMARAHALRALAQRFPAGVQFVGSERQVLSDLLRDHAQAMQAALGDVETAMKTVLPAVPVPSAEKPADWQDGTARVFRAAQGLDQLLNTLLAAGGDSTGRLPELAAALRQVNAEVRAFLGSVP